MLDRGNFHIMNSLRDFANLDNCQKPERIVENSLGITNLDTPIYRIARTDFMWSDVNGGFNTLVRPCEETQGDENENPLRNHLFQIGKQHHPLLQGVMSDIYTQSWSFSIPPWNQFANGHDKLRLQSTPRRLLEALMDTSNRNYSFSYFIGAVAYMDDDALEQARNRTDLTECLLFNGLDLIESVCRLCSTLSSENEVRLIFHRTEDSLGNFDTRYPLKGFDGCLCSHPFDWKSVLVDYEFCSNNRDGHAQLRRYLAGIHTKLGFS